MEHRDASLWPHTTAENSRTHGEPVGVDLFDEVTDGITMTSIYIRFADGTRWPCRTVNMTIPDHAESVINAWSSKGEVNDYRKPQ